MHLLYCGSGYWALIAIILFKVVFWGFFVTIREA